MSSVDPLALLDDAAAAPDNPESEEFFNEHSDAEEEYFEETRDENDGEYIGPVLPGGHRFDKRLVCIRYPGNVINPDKAIQTLGGLSEISSTVDNKSRRMELRFRPDDGYCNPTCGDRNETVGFLLRVRVKKSRREKVEATQSSDNKSDEANDDESMDENVSSQKSKSGTKESIPENDSELNENDLDRNKSPTFDRKKYEDLSKDANYSLPKLKVLGRVDTEFRFTSLCDFQYLPITKNLKDPLKDECIYDKIYPVGLPPASWMDNEVPFFLPPAAFSRMDSVQQYVPKPEVPTNGNTSADVIGKTRKRRGGFSNFISFNTPDVPVSPPKGIETALKVKFLQFTHVEKMRKLFEQRPIWSKTAVRYLTNFTNEQLKVLLPAVAYYFITGPWRITWVKLGYDPRKDPESRIYQTLDFRMKGTDGLLSNSHCKRSSYSEYMLKNRSVPNAKPRTAVLMANSSLLPKKKRVTMEENVYVFRPGTIPPSRQMLYQYCDVHVKEIEDMLDKYLGPPPGTPCHEKMGWLPINFDDLCREIISKYIRLELRKLMNIPENHPTSLPRAPKQPSARSKKISMKKRKAHVDAISESVMAQLPATNEEEEDPLRIEGEEYGYAGENGARLGFDETGNGVEAGDEDDIQQVLGEIENELANDNENDNEDESESEIHEMDSDIEMHDGGNGNGDHDDNEFEMGNEDHEN